MQEPNIQAAKLYTLQLPSTVESIAELELLIEEIADTYQVSEDTFANMMTCLNEALINAIKHGNKFSATKKVIVNADVDNKRLIWTVTDEGEGFDYVHLPDPTAPENLLSEDGRGLFLMQRLMDRVERFQSDGNVVRLTLNRE